MPPRKYPSDSARKSAWAKDHTTRVNLKLNHNTDADIIAHLERIDNKMGYLKALIRADMSAGTNRKPE